MEELWFFQFQCQRQVVYIHSCHKHPSLPLLPNNTIDQWNNWGREKWHDCHFFHIIFVLFKNAESSTRSFLTPNSLMCDLTQNLFSIPTSSQKLLLSRETSLIPKPWHSCPFIYHLYPLGFWLSFHLVSEPWWSSRKLKKHPWITPSESLPKSIKTYHLPA